MLYLTNNINKYIKSDILLLSPDADLILLSIISYAKNIKIDILRINFYTNYDNDIRNYNIYMEKNINNYYELKLPFYYSYGYIFINKSNFLLSKRKS